MGELGLDELGAVVAFAVVAGEDLVGFFGAVFVDEPAGALGDEASLWLVFVEYTGIGVGLQDEGHLEDGRRHLQP